MDNKHLLPVQNHNQHSAIAGQSIQNIPSFLNSQNHSNQQYMINSMNALNHQNHLYQNLAENNHQNHFIYHHLHNDIQHSPFLDSKRFNQDSFGFHNPYMNNVHPHFQSNNQIMNQQDHFVGNQHNLMHHNNQQFHPSHHSMNDLSHELFFHSTPHSVGFQNHSQPPPTIIKAQTLEIPKLQSTDFLPSPSESKSNLDGNSVDLSLHTVTGFDVATLFVKLVTRQNPKVKLGPIDFNSAFAVSDLSESDLPIVYISPAFTKMTGYSSNEVFGKNCRFLQNPNGVQEAGSTRMFTDANVVENMMKCIQKRDEGQFLLVNYKKNGTPFLNHITLIPLAMGANGDQITHYIGIQVDMLVESEQIEGRFNEELFNAPYANKKVALMAPPEPIEPTPPTESLGVTNKSVPKFMATFTDSMSDIVIVISLRGLFLYASSACNQILEFSGAEIVGKKLSEFVHPADFTTIMRDLRVCSTEGSANFLCRMKRKVSGYVFFEMNAHVYTASKRNRSFIINCRNLDLSVIPAVLYRTPASNSEDETWVKVSQDGIIIYANETCQEFFQKTPGQLLSNSIYDSIQITDREKLESSLKSHTHLAPFHCNITQPQMNLNCLFVLLKTHMLFTWIQIKKDSYDTVHESTVDLFQHLDPSQNASIHFEANRLKLQNNQLVEEIKRLENI
ncbi:hypothetical protein BC833DRAFT_579878 [Globomyces pollinis-pini]|nr:hypothetical protein BC833DRAFT_579878 [Globomyces pollinis-pini]